VTHLLGEAIAVAVVTSKSGRTSRRASLPDALWAQCLKKMWRPLTARRHIADASVLAPAVMLAVSSHNTISKRSLSDESRRNWFIDGRVLRDFRSSRRAVA
jgi:hypothetical protein